MQVASPGDSVTSGGDCVTSSADFITSSADSMTTDENCDTKKLLQFLSEHFLQGIYTHIHTYKNTYTRIHTETYIHTNLNNFAASDGRTERIVEEWSSKVSRLMMVVLVAEKFCIVR